MFFNTIDVEEEEEEGNCHAQNKLPLMVRYIVIVNDLVKQL